MGGHLLGWRTVCAVEFDAYARSVLLARQRDGCLPRFPFWDDVRTFDGNPWRGHVYVISGGFPCQDISAAGKGAGIDGERSGLWREMARIVGEVRPSYVWVENSPLLVSRGLAVVLGDLAQMGYDARWGVVGAADAIWNYCDPCADHERNRLWILADANADRLREPQPQRSISNERRRVGDGCSQGSNPVRNRGEARISGPEPRQEWQSGEPFNGRSGCASEGGWWQSEPQLGRVADGMAAGVDVHGTHAGIDVGRVATGIPKRSNRLRCVGNGQVPAALVMAWNELTKS